jgi:hypothetical protein
MTFEKLREQKRRKNKKMNTAERQRRFQDSKIIKHQAFWARLAQKLFVVAFSVDLDLRLQRKTS